jgi:beta-N-acetylhexosaminidase
MKYVISWLIMMGCIQGQLAMAAEVSLRDKIGQMLIMGFAGTTVDSHAAVVQSIAQDNLGGVILFDYDYQTKSFDKNIASPQQVRQLTTDLQRFTHLANQRYQRPQLPLLIAVDYEGGEVNLHRANLAIL